MSRKLFWLGLLGVAGSLAACADVPPPPPPPYGPPPPWHVRWCANHHPGYNPNNNLYPGPDGRWHPCRHGYGPGYGPPPPGYPPPPPNGGPPPPPPPG
jgi:hypothetical protein